MEQKRSTEGRRGIREHRLLKDRAAVAVDIARMRARRAVGRVVLANGCFDLLHVGHVRFLEDARSLGDYLVVALNDDESVRAIKGEGRPIVPLEERAEILLALRCIDAVTSFGELDAGATLGLLRPDVHAKGTDYTEETVPEAEVDRELEIEIAICGGPKVRSSSDLTSRPASEPKSPLPSHPQERSTSDLADRS